MHFLQLFDLKIVYLYPLVEVFLDVVLKSSGLICWVKMDLIYNPRQIQQSDSAVCARYACFAARNLNKYKTFDDFLKEWTNNKKENDEKILLLTKNYF